MKTKQILVQNALITLPFFHLFIINRFQIRISEIVKLSIFFIIYLVLFNIFRFLIDRYFPLKNSKYFAVIIFYLIFNYSNITIFLYFKAFDFLKLIPNYSFTLFALLMVVLLIFSTKIYFEKLFEFITLSYFVLLLMIFFNSFNLEIEETDHDQIDIDFQENIVFNETPDIYFVIYDGLPSISTMEKFYEYDTNMFNKLLINNNLKNYKLATSSFGRTTYTMSSLFNMQYIFEDGDIQFTDRANLSRSYQTGESRFENILRNNDYTLYKFGLSFTCNKEKNDICINKNINGYEEKDSVYVDLIMRTPIKIFVEKGFLKLNNNLSFGCGVDCSDPPLLEIFENIDSNDKPKAVFLHFMDTHGPYLLGNNCELLEEPIYDLPKTNIKSYKESLNCAYTKIEKLIGSLDLENDVIFIQSDHGPNFEKMELTNIEELSSDQILNRYSVFSVSNLENFCEDKNINLDETVNTFIFFSNCFGEQSISILEVKNYLAFGKIDSSVYDITNLVQDKISINYK